MGNRSRWLWDKPVKGYAEEAGEWSFGGGTESSPKVMDMVVPEGMKQEDILNYKDHTVALPGILVGDYMKPTFTSLSIADPEGDDYGPGGTHIPRTQCLKLETLTCWVLS